MSGDETFPGVCTDWRPHDVPAMWQMLAKEDGQHSWDQVTGWRQISELLNFHSARLRAARDQLAAGWQGGAAGVFLAFIDQLVGSMDGTATVAASNSATLAGITTSLQRARESIGQLHDQWQRYSEAERQNNRPMIRGASPGVLEPRPPEDWRQELNQQGATIMTSMENEVLDYAQSTEMPKSYDPFGPYDYGGSLTDIDQSRQQLGTSLEVPETVWQTPTVQQDAYGQGPTLSGHTEVSAPASNIVGRPIGTRAPTEVPVSLLPSIHQVDWSRAMRVPKTPLPERRQSETFGLTKRWSAIAGEDGPAANYGLNDEQRRTSTLASPSSPADEEQRRQPSVPGAASSPVANGYGQRRLKRFEPSPIEEWHGLRGVPPVLAPKDRRQRHSPGPGVIGIDR